jgi:hypothetical protein
VEGISAKNNEVGLLGPRRPLRSSRALANPAQCLTSRVTAGPVYRLPAGVPTPDSRLPTPEPTSGGDETRLDSGGLLQAQ